jgi:hypothetical protein
MPGRLYENYMYVRNVAKELCKKGSTGNMQDCPRRNCARNSAQAVGINVIALDMLGSTRSMQKKTAQEMSKKGSTVSIEEQHKDYTRQGAQELYRKKQHKKYIR